MITNSVNLPLQTVALAVISSVEWYDNSKWNGICKQFAVYFYTSTKSDWLTFGITYDLAILNVAGAIGNTTFKI